MIKAIFFDLDGVLADIKDIHYEALNSALPKEFRISKEEHYQIYDGLPTNEKIQLLKVRKGMFDSTGVEQKKQEITIEKIFEYKIPKNVLDTVRFLKDDFYLAICSNSVKDTVIMIQDKFIDNDSDNNVFQSIYSNENCRLRKPNPEIYLNAVRDSGFEPREVLIIEDSPKGIHAALSSGCNVLRVNDTSEVTVENIMNEVSRLNKIEIRDVYQNRKMNVVIPMAGRGSRFAEQGYKMPKPLIDVAGKFMIQRVIENINIDANFIFIVKQEDITCFNIDLILKAIKPNCKIVITDGITEGTACTCLLAKEFIDNENPVFFCNSDQLVLDWEPNEFFYNALCRNLDASILTFDAEGNKWSYAKTNDKGFVTEVAEKRAISEQATVGFYYYKKGSDFVKAANKMIEKGIRTNNEFYLCPVFNEMIEMKKKIGTYKIEEMHGIGTPDDLNLFLNVNNFLGQN